MFRESQPCRARDPQSQSKPRKHPTQPSLPAYVAALGWDQAPARPPTEMPLLVLAHLPLPGAELNRELIVLTRFHLDDQFPREMKGFDR